MSELEAPSELSTLDRPDIGAGELEAKPVLPGAPARGFGRRTARVAVLAALIGAGVGGGVGATVALHVGRHPTVTIVHETLPAPDRLSKVNDIPSILTQVEPSIVTISSD